VCPQSWRSTRYEGHNSESTIVMALHLALPVVARQFPELFPLNCSTKPTGDERLRDNNDGLEFTIVAHGSESAQVRVLAS